MNIIFKKSYMLIKVNMNNTTYVPVFENFHKDGVNFKFLFSVFFERCNLSYFFSESGIIYSLHLYSVI